MKKFVLILTILLSSCLGLSAQEYYGRVQDSDGYTNVREAPSTNAAIVRRCQSGNYIFYTPLSNEWCKVYSSKDVNSFIGYMHSSRIVKVTSNAKNTSSNKNESNTVLNYGRVQDSDGYTNIREAASTNAAIVRQYQSGNYLYYTPIDNGWSKVYSGKDVNTFMGYVHTSRIVMVNPDGTSSSAAQSNMQEGSVNNVKEEKEMVLNSCEQLPSFPGGDAALMKYISSRIQYPPVAAANKIQGNVIVKFVVTKTGKVGDVKIVRSKGKDLDDEAIRVCKSLPNFNPGRQNGQAVSVWYTLAVPFKL